MNWLDAGFLLGAGLVAGGMNAVAGGGSFFSFPALLAVGIPPVSANATNSVGLWPANIASVLGYRRELRQQQKDLRLLSGLSLLGGAIGGALLLRTNDATFARLVPFLLLFATALFASSGWINRTMQRRTAAGAPGLHRAIVPLILFIVSIYGGFFGAGMGIMLLAAIGLMGNENIHEMNAVKTWLSMLITTTTTVLFVAAGAVRWPEVLLIVVGGSIGGYGGAALARLLNPLHVRRFVIVVGALLSVYYFVR